MKSEPKSELKDMDDSDTKLEKKPDKACINDCAPNEQCCVCSGQCNLEPEDQALLKSLDALVGCENNCEVEVRFFGYLGTRMESIPWFIRTDHSEITSNISNQIYGSF